MGDGTDASVLPVGVQFLIISLLGAHTGAEAAGRRAAEQVQSLVRHLVRQDGEAFDFLSKGHAVHPVKAGVDQAGQGQFAEDGDDAAGAVHVLDMVFRSVGRHLADAGHPAGKRVDVGHGEVYAGFLRDGKQVQDRVGGAAHRDIERHCVEEGSAGGDAAGQDALISVPVVFPGVFHDERGGLPEQFRAVAVGRQDRSVARKGQPDGLGQAVHRIGGEHARAAAAAGTGTGLDLRHLIVRQGGVGGQDHRVDQVQFAVSHDAGFHRSSGDEDRRDVEAHRGHQHAGRDLVTVADADHGVGFVGVHHILHAVGDDFPGGERIEHAVMPHRDAVINGDGVEFGGKAA